MKSIIDKIRAIIKDESLDLADKICDIQKTLPEEPKKFEAPKNLISTISEAIGLPFVCDGGKMIVEGNQVTFCGAGPEDMYIDDPRLANSDDLYYQGGPTWGIDMDGKRYWKRYSVFNDRDHGKYTRLSHGDIYNDEARIKKYIKEALQEYGLI